MGLGDADQFAGQGVLQVLAFQVGLLEAGDSLGLAVAVEKDVILLHFHSGKVAVLNALADGVLVYGLAEVLDVVGGDLLVLFGFR